MQISRARSARRHRIGRPRIVHLIESCGLIFRQQPPAGAPAGATERSVCCLGDDPVGVALEVMAVPLEEGVLVIHAMLLRKSYRAQYEEAKRWRP